MKLILLAAMISSFYACSSLKNTKRELASYSSDGNVLVSNTWEMKCVQLKVIRDIIKLKKHFHFKYDKESQGSYLGPISFKRLNIEDKIIASSGSHNFEVSLKASIVKDQKFNLVKVDFGNYYMELARYDENLFMGWARDYDKFQTDKKIGVCSLSVI